MPRRSSASRCEVYRHSGSIRASGRSAATFSTKICIARIRGCVAAGQSVFCSRPPSPEYPRKFRFLANGRACRRDAWPSSLRQARVPGACVRARVRERV
jgi:hypothetical protein